LVRGNQPGPCKKDCYIPRKTYTAAVDAACNYGSNCSRSSVLPNGSLASLSSSASSSRRARNSMTPKSNQERGHPRRAAVRPRPWLRSRSTLPPPSRRRDESWVFLPRLLNALVPYRSPPRLVPSIRPIGVSRTVRQQECNEHDRLYPGDWNDGNSLPVLPSARLTHFPNLPRPPKRPADLYNERSCPLPRRNSAWCVSVP
jgi:hypothetical protein